MGSFEKLVVLTVLFLVALVLGVTLNSGEPEAAGPDYGSPLASARERAERGAEGAEGEAGGVEPGAAAAPSDAGAEGGFLSRGAGDNFGDGNFEDGNFEDGGLGLLNARVRRPAAPEPAVPEPAVPGTLLVTTDGLSKHPLIPDFRIYRVRPNDTWAALSERFYGDRGHTDLLRQANDDPASLVSGEEILVPVHDFRRGDESRSRLRPWEIEESRAGSDRPAPRRGSAPPVPSDATPEEYLVVEGDSLSVISLKVYGTSRRWEEIFEANDVLEDPDELQVGMRLRIP